jgi:hypothetical protein
MNELGIPKLPKQRKPKTPNLPKHRKLMMESLELLFAGNKAGFKKTIKQAKSETSKFYTK